ncbi:RagB/SusD family nutrient uptake outer membrane protein [Spirosoma sp. KUDC1026]|uniref:RagB/SusD family nutrient uptake outer membrane protein n=1 Tax=Spirosoma sp. KUDC1026 TaxID=2745947 RepID=UPI00159BD41E|nr:RagB/SusD family nutrient uptake outer membrane protein [Spirosoma sp. KUDC1026]QKZ11351.1 RagB/SusD family nutrient uptake outer membrane protein [Spirosoma sp. KUDC1026]
MKTKHSLLFMSALSLSLWLTSCDNKLNIEPVTSIGTSQALSTAADLQALLAGAYDGISSAYLYGGDLQRDGELLGTVPNTGDVLWTGTFAAPQQIYTKNILINNSQADLTWTEAYRTINICNTVLANLNLAATANRPRIEGEAKFIRGSMYFELVRFFGKAWGDGDANVNLGVPIVTTPTAVLNAGSNIPRNTVAAVYAQIIQDLTQAETNLPNDGTNGFFATKSAASAQLSRVYLQQADYPNAANAANRVIGRNTFSLVPLEGVFDLRAFLNGVNTAETIFAVQITDQDGTNDLNTFYGSSEVGGRGDIEITEAFFNQLEADDYRGALFYQDDIGAIRTYKYYNQYGNIQVFRLAEMYLTRAEANFRAGTTVGATPLADINLIRARAELGAITQAQLTVAEILRQRRIELAFEGTLIHDLKRTRSRVGSLNWNDSRLIYPIPLREITTNPALVQNQGY